MITLSTVMTHQAAPHAAHELLLLTTPVSRTPAQSRAMLAGTDGLPPWLDIDRFHVSRRSSAPYPTAMVRGSAVSILHLFKETFKGTTSTTNHVAVAALTYSLRESVREVRKTTQT